MLHPRQTPSAQVGELQPGAWQLEIPAGPAGSYRLAQLDDYAGLPRRRFPWQPPVTLTLQARASSAQMPGTWGFGLWNDPFGLGMPQGGGGLRLPALPNCAWFFFASQENHLSLHDGLPGSGALAATFRSRTRNTSAYVLGLLSLPLLAWQASARWLRRKAAGWVEQSAALIEIDPLAWHRYSIAWGPGQVRFHVDENLVLETPITPCGRLACVLWIDNQYAAWEKNGRLRYGTLSNPEAAWIEFSAIRLQPHGVSCQPVGDSK